LPGNNGKAVTAGMKACEGEMNNSSYWLPDKNFGLHYLTAYRSCQNPPERRCLQEVMMEYQPIREIGKDKFVVMPVEESDNIMEGLQDESD
jgi:hypothetical protein